MNLQEKVKIEMEGQPRRSTGFVEPASLTLRNKIERKARYVEALQILMKVIPWDLLSQHDEEILQAYFIGRDS